VRIRAGEPVGELHLWNEHIPRLEAKSGLDWSLRARRAIGASLEALAEAAVTDERLKDVQAFVGRSVLAHRAGPEQVRRVMGRLGFEVREVHCRGWRERGHEVLENVLIWGLTWAYNRQALRGKPFMRPRVELWVSRKALLAEHLRGGAQRREARGVGVGVEGKR